jgi:protein involved in polysaccharide export with SLBB domain
VTIAVDDLLVKADARVNIPIFANDVINVPTASEITVYCLGEVGSPGAITFKSNERISVLSAIARAGGLGERAAKTIRIKRQVGDEERIFEVDYKRLLSGKAPDVGLESGDVLYVKQSFL